MELTNDTQIPLNSIRGFKNAFQQMCFKSLASVTQPKPPETRLHKTISRLQRETTKPTVPKVLATRVDTQIHSYPFLEITEYYKPPK